MDGLVLVLAVILNRVKRDAESEEHGSWVMPVIIEPAAE